MRDGLLAVLEILGLLVALGGVSLLAAWTYHWMTLGSYRRDCTAATILEEGLHPYLAQTAGDAHDQVASAPILTGMRLGEISRHFDTNTSYAVDGWLSHHLGFRGFGIRGESHLAINAEATSRENLMGDGFVAVLEQEGGASPPDTVRVIVPPEQVAREVVQGLLSHAAAQFTTAKPNGQRIDNPRAYATLLRLTPQLLRFQCEVSYVSDRLHAVLRMPTDSRPLINVWGIHVSRHLVLASAVQIGTDSATERLFPLELVNVLETTTKRAAQTAKPAVSYQRALPKTEWSQQHPDSKAP